MKNTIKKSLSLLLSCLLIMSMTVIMASAETDGVTIQIGSVSANAGEQVVVPVTIGADSNVASGAFAIDFDSAYLTFVEATAGTLALTQCEVGVTADNVNQIGVAFLGQDLAAVDAAGGTLFNLVFEVNASAPTKEAVLGFNFEPTRETDRPGLFDVDSAEVAYNAINGAVAIAGSAAYVPATVALGTASAKPGETVAIPVTITENSYVVSGAFAVEYDGAVLEYVDYVAGSVENVSQLSVAATADGEDAVGIVFSTENATTAITAGGTIATLNFRVSDTAVAGDTALTFNLVRPDDALTQGGVATAEALDEEATFVNGKVTVEELVTSTEVTFHVTPENVAATVAFNGEEIATIEGYATFENVVFGEKEYTVSAEGYVTASGMVTVEVGMATVEVALEAVPTTTNVVFNVTPATAAVTLNGATINAVDGVATFENVEFGTYTYSVAAEGYVTANGSVTVAADMEPVTVVLEEAVAEKAPVPTLVGLRTFSQTYDEETQTITVTALNTNASAGIAIALDEITELGNYTLGSSTGINFVNSGGYRYFVAKLANGANQIFTIKAKVSDTVTYTYTVNISFIADPLSPADIATLRAFKAEVNETKKQILVDYDNGNVLARAASIGVAVIPNDGVTVTYTYKSSSPDGTTTGFGVAITSKYTLLSTGENTEAAGGGALGDVNMKIFKLSNGNTMKTEVVLSDGTNTKTYELQVRQRDQRVAGDINITAIKGLRVNEESIVFDNEAKTIYMETTTANSSAGFAVAVDNGLTKATRPRRIIAGQSGKSLSVGEISDTALKDRFDRYIVARLSAGTEQTFNVTVFGGETGREYSVFTVTMVFKRVYEGDIEFAELKSKNADEVIFDNEANTITVNYSGDSATIAPVVAGGVSVRVYSADDKTVIYSSAVDGKSGYAVKASNGAVQTAELILRIGNDTTTYAVTFNYVGA